MQFSRDSGIDFGTVWLQGNWLKIGLAQLEITATRDLDYYYWPIIEIVSRRQASAKSQVDQTSSAQSGIDAKLAQMEIVCRQDEICASQISLKEEEKGKSDQC